MNPPPENPTPEPISLTPEEWRSYEKVGKVLETIQQCERSVGTWTSIARRTYAEILQLQTKPAGTVRRWSWFGKPRVSFPQWGENQAELSEKQSTLRAVVEQLVWQHNRLCEAREAINHAQDTPRYAVEPRWTEAGYMAELEQSYLAYRRDS